MKKKTRIRTAFCLSAAAAPLPAAAAGFNTAAAAFPLTLGNPAMLLGLAALPLLWLLFRFTPPVPQRVEFPALTILKELSSKESTPAQMPWWHKMIRLGAASLVVMGLAKPVLNPAPPGSALPPGNGPLLLVIDDGWASARGWRERTAAMKSLIDRAERENRAVFILPTALPSAQSLPAPGGPVSAEAARRYADSLIPHPWPEDRRAAAEILSAASFSGKTSAVWLGNGLDSEGAGILAERLLERGTLTVMADNAATAPRLISSAENGPDGLAVTVRRVSSSGAESAMLAAVDENGTAVEQATAVFAPGQTEARAVFGMPAEMRNRLSQIVIAGENGAGGVLLLDERSRRRHVGIVDAVRAGNPAGSPLLEETSYIERALSPYVDVSRGTVEDMLKKNPSVLALTDSAAPGAAAQEKVEQWVREGGTLLRFAGPRLAAQGSDGDKLLPVQVRPGTRSLGGQLSGGDPQRPAPFERASPFGGLGAPGDVKITREILTRPSMDLDSRTWARLEDGTPLVTAERRGKGLIVLVHTTPTPAWSDLVLSGSFVGMMRAVVLHSQGAQSAGAGTGANATGFLPLKTLDGFGRLSFPPDTARPLTAAAAEKGTVTPQNPPGVYGKNAARHAHNLGPGIQEMKPLPVPPGARLETYESGPASGETDLSGPLLAGAFALVLADLGVTLARRGGRKMKQPAPSG